MAQGISAGTIFSLSWALAGALAACGGILLGTAPGGVAAAAALYQLGPEDTLSTAVVRGARARRPNIVFIMTDDHAQSALGVYGSKVLKTPHLDRIGNEGLRFELGFVTNALCLPSRASFLTGQYSHTHGLRTNGAESGFTSEPKLRNAQTWPNLLRADGASDVIIAATHGVLSDPAAQRLADCGAREVIVTNTLPIGDDKMFPQLTVLSIAPLLANTIRAVFENGSVTGLFDGSA